MAKKPTKSAPVKKGSGKPAKAKPAKTPKKAIKAKPATTKKSVAPKKAVAKPKKEVAKKKSATAKKIVKPTKAAPTAKFKEKTKDSVNPKVAVSLKSKEPVHIQPAKTEAPKVISTAKAVEVAKVATPPKKSPISKVVVKRNYIDEILAPVGPAKVIARPEDEDIELTENQVKTTMHTTEEKPKSSKKNDDGKKGINVEDKLRALYDLQLIDTRIDKIRAVRGELPLEVQDLEDEVAGLQTRIENLKNETENLDKEIANRKNAIKDSEGLIKKYKDQQGKVRNNREFDSLSKEIEFQELEILLFKKKIKEHETLKMTKGELIESAESKLSERSSDLKVKKAELDEIVAETEKEERFLLKKSEEAQKVIEDRLLQAYKRIREASKNGLAVVPIEREASAGSFITIPPQKQLDVASRKKIIVDEHSGRILVDSELAIEETERIEGLLQKELGR